MALPHGELEKLRSQLTGRLLQAGDPGYDQSLVIDNGRIDLRPGAVVKCANVQDVIAAYKFAVSKKVPFTVRGGGHSAAGYCLNQGGLVIDLSNMNAKRLDADRQVCWAQTGNRWRDIYIYLQNTNTGFIPIGGGCPTVGIPGFMLGGGLSFVSRSYGLSVDNLVSIDIVTPDGELRTISADSKSKEEQDLWWACRGGGGGNFGIAVAFELRVHRPPTPKMLVGQIRYPAEAAQDVYGFYNEWIETVPDRLAVYGFMGKVPLPAHPDLFVNSIGLTPIFNGDPREGMDLIAPILKFPNIFINLYEMTLPDFEIFNGLLTNVGGNQAYIRSGFMPPKAFTPQAISTLIDAMSSAPSERSLLVWTHMGGKIEQVPPEGTSFWHRKARFLWEVKAIWANQDAMLQNVDWGYALGEAMRPHDVGAYVNYIDPLLADWPQQFYGGNYDRLVRIKKQWDPTSNFNFQQAIGSPFEPTPGNYAPLFRTFAD
ncbi:MAG: FAD-binding oxidoreductase [Acidobacteriota bacterium]